jgi:amidase
MPDAILPAVHYLSLLDLSDQIRRRALTPTAVTEAMLARIASLDGSLKSYTTVLGEHALTSARKLESELQRGLWRGPLHGVPIAVKDLCFTTYGPTSAGMYLNRSFVPGYNATVIDRLERAGAVILGKLTMTEGAFAVHHPKMFTPVNPWNSLFWTGASSSGSGVATAAGLCFGSLGSDTGGSIRLPCAACGVTGVKPTWGRVSRYGVFALAESLDHIGPMTRSAADAAAMLAAIAGADPNDPTALNAPVPDYLAELGGGVRGLRVGLDETFVFNGLDPDVAAVMNAAITALTDLGARFVSVRFPISDRLFEAWTSICLLEAALAHEKTYPSLAAEYGPGLSSALETGRKVSAFELGKAMHERLAYNGRMAEFFAAIDLAIVPVISRVVPSSTEWLEIARGDFTPIIRYSAPFDMTGSPTVTLPGGFDRNRVPIGFQLVGPRLSEALLLRVGHSFQQVTDWHTHHPEPAPMGADG